MKAPETIIKRPLLTEKGTRLKDRENKVMVEVPLHASKTEIRQAVEKLLSVRVARVHTQVVRGKEKRMGKFVGKRPNWKKAIVTLREGSDVDFFTLGG